MDLWLKTGCLFKSDKTPVDHPIIHSSTTAPDFEATHGSEAEGCSKIKSNPTKNKEKIDEHGEKKGKKRKYNDDYLQMGFYFIGEESEPKPLCVICNEVLANSSLKPSLLRRHLETKHPTHKDKPVEYFKGKLTTNNKCSVFSFLSTSNEDSKMALEASFRVSYRIARYAQAHTMAENLIGPCAKDIVKCMLGEKAAKKIDLVPLSNNTMSRRINDLANDVESELLKRIKMSNFAIQLDESTDVANVAVLLVYVRYIFKNSFQEDILFAKPLKTYTTGEAIFDLINGYFEKNEINWFYCVGVCTDGAKSMTGKYSGLVARVKKINEKIEWTHCCIHRQALACKRIPAELSTTLSDAVKIVNFIKSRATNYRLFHALCEDFGSIHLSLLLHTEVRWLSRGKVLTRLFELKSEVQAFFNDHPFQLSSCLFDILWLQKLAYLADIFCKLNELNLSLQGADVTIFIVHDKIEAMLKKFNFWIQCLEMNEYQCFSSLSSFLSENSIELDENIKRNIYDHLKHLQLTFEEYFPNRHNISLSNSWICSPFEGDVSLNTSLTLPEKEKLIELSCDSSLKVIFKDRSLFDFWLSVINEYPVLSKKAIKILLPFCTTYLCEKGFSTYTYLKNKYRNRLNAEPDLRLKLSEIEPNFEHLCSTKQAQISH